MIDAALIDGDAFSNIAQRFGVSPTAVFRHKADHVPAALVKAQEAENASQAGDLLGQVRKRQEQGRAAGWDLLGSDRARGAARRSAHGDRRCRRPCQPIERSGRAWNC